MYNISTNSSSQLYLDTQFQCLCMPFDPALGRCWIDIAYTPGQLD